MFIYSYFGLSVTGTYARKARLAGATLFKDIRRYEVWKKQTHSYCIDYKPFEGYSDGFLKYLMHLKE
jgi:hypothetical protein